MAIRSNRVLTRRKSLVTIIPVTVTVVNHQLQSTRGTPFTVLANSRPLNSRETEFLAEGQRADDFRIFNCETNLQVADDKNEQAGAIVTNHLGFEWRLVGEKNWGTGNRHNYYMMQKIGVTP